MLTDHPYAEAISYAYGILLKSPLNPLRHKARRTDAFVKGKLKYNEKTPDKIIEFIKENFVIIKKGIVIIRKRK